MMTERKRKKEGVVTQQNSQEQVLFLVGGEKDMWVSKKNLKQKSRQTM